MEKISFKNGRILEYSRGIKCELSDAEDKLVITILSENGKTFATRNMQEDVADFEAIAFSTWSVNPDCHIVLKYDSYGWNEQLKEWTHSLDFTSENRRKAGERKISAEICHYSRFLYRAYMMMELYDGFYIDAYNVDEVNHFGRIYREALKKREFVINVPKGKSGIKEINENGLISENHLEKWFVINTSNLRKQKTPIITEKCGNIELHDQLPCGLFYKTVSVETRIFNTGYVDLWSASENTISIFELKKEGNEKLGIISELFFYSCLIKDFTSIINLDYERYREKSFERGFSDFVKSVSEKTMRIKAYFLAPAFHSFIDPSSLSGNQRNNKCHENMQALLNVMNSRDDGVEYDYIIFDQKAIVGNDVKKYVGDLMNEWQQILSLK